MSKFDIVGKEVIQMKADNMRRVIQLAFRIGFLRACAETNIHEDVGPERRIELTQMLQEIVDLSKDEMEICIADAICEAYYDAFYDSTQD